MLRRVRFITAFLITTCIFSAATQVFAYNFGDFRSETLVTKAWQALSEKDIEAVLAYTNKCIELYADQAKKMQASLTDYVKGSNDDIFAYWALNDVATALFIQGEAYRNANMMDEAKAAYQKLIDQYSFGQCYDPKGWFWKPADAAKEKLAMIESGSNIDFGDYASVTLTTKAWKALKDKDIDSVVAYTNKCLELYGDKATEMQNSLTEYPIEKDKIFSFWALNDVGTCLYIKGMAFLNAGVPDLAKKAFQKLVDEYYYAQCWDLGGWFWKPADGAREKMDELEASGTIGSSASAKEKTEKVEKK